MTLVLIGKGSRLVGQLQSYMKKTMSNITHLPRPYSFPVSMVISRSWTGSVAQAPKQGTNRSQEHFIIHRSGRATYLSYPCQIKWIPCERNTATATAGVEIPTLYQAFPLVWWLGTVEAVTSTPLKWWVKHPPSFRPGLFETMLLLMPTMGQKKNETGRPWETVSRTCRELSTAWGGTKARTPPGRKLKRQLHIWPPKRYSIFQQLWLFLIACQGWTRTLHPCCTWQWTSRPAESRVFDPKNWCIEIFNHPISSRYPYIHPSSIVCKFLHHFPHHFK